MSAAERWRHALRAWAIPDRILSAAPEPPYGFPAELFRRRAERAASLPPTPTTVRAAEVLPAGGSILDVGVGGGATSLPLADRAARVVGVDPSPAMLSAFRETGTAAGVAVETIEGPWPDVAPATPRCEVVVCGHVFYNVQELQPFVLALDDHAGARVVVELTGEHPWTWMNDLWRRFHDLERPASPTAEDARDLLRELGFRPGWERRTPQPQPSGFERREEAVALVRRRLCLTADADDAVAEALGDRLSERDGLWSAGPASTTLVTMWWGAGDRAGAADQSDRRAT